MPEFPIHAHFMSEQTYLVKFVVVSREDGGVRTYKITRTFNYKQARYKKKDTRYLKYVYIWSLVTNGKDRRPETERQVIS